MVFQADYYERVYAGVLGKIIGVYLGRPFEGWSYERIMSELGEIEYYVNDQVTLPLNNRQIVVTDDDITGTFTFLRAMPDYGNRLDLSPEKIGQTWLNYIIENRTILWWGGLGNSTEHTAYLRLKSGIPAPQSGSMELNGKVVAEQIGAQIFIEGWGLICPGDPKTAADLASRAASVSHDGEALYAAQVIAAMVAMAFIEQDLDVLLNTAVALVPEDSLIYQMVADIRNWHTADSEDWHGARSRLADIYGYDTYGGNCHVIPNHGLVILSLLFGGGDFSKSQRIVNTCGWDTDCNAANVGCILGVMNGLSAFHGDQDWRDPIRDRLYIPTVDGGRAISDSLYEADQIMEIAHALWDEPWEPPKGGARFHFSLPGSVQGFVSRGNLAIKNGLYPKNSETRSLALSFHLEAGETGFALTDTFIPPESIDRSGYELVASPMIYPGQWVSARVLGDDSNTNPIQISIAFEKYGSEDIPEVNFGPWAFLQPGEVKYLTWQIPDLKGAMIVRIGLAVKTNINQQGNIYLDSLTWEGSPHVCFQRPGYPGKMWKRQWVDAVDYFEDNFEEAYRIIQNRGRGMVVTGTRQWRNYSLESTITPHLVQTFGLAVRVQGLERYYALLLENRDIVKLVKKLDGEKVLRRIPFIWHYDQSYHLKLTVNDNAIKGWVNSNLLFQIEDQENTLTHGAIGLVCEEGRIGTDFVLVQPLKLSAPLNHA